MNKRENVTIFDSNLVRLTYTLSEIKLNDKTLKNFIQRNQSKYSKKQQNNGSKDQFN